MSAVVKFKEAAVRRGSSWILADINWRVVEGERWVILGANGAGKSTLLQLAAARIHPTYGTVRVLGSRLGQVDVFELRPRIGLASASVVDDVPATEQAVDVVLTAAWGISGRWRERYEVQDVQRAHELLALMGVADLAERTFGTLSEGERKRVVIARALMTDPELLLLDEPAAGLDLGAREELVGRLSALALAPASPVSILVTHHVEEIPPGTTHALLLRHGRIVAQGPIGEALTSANLTQTFALPLAVSQFGRRWAARAW